VTDEEGGADQVARRHELGRSHVAEVVQVDPLSQLRWHNLRGRLADRGAEVAVGEHLTSGLHGQGLEEFHRPGRERHAPPPPVLVGVRGDLQEGLPAAPVRTHAEAPPEACTEPCLEEDFDQTPNGPSDTVDATAPRELRQVGQHRTDKLDRETFGVPSVAVLVPGTLSLPWARRELRQFGDPPVRLGEHQDLTERGELLFHGLVGHLLQPASLVRRQGSRGDVGKAWECWDEVCREVHRP
jgi:hypothetical protein